MSVKWQIANQANRWLLYKQDMVIRKLTRKDLDGVTSPRARDVLFFKMSEFVFEFMCNVELLPKSPSFDEITGLIEEFWCTYQAQPFVENYGGSSFNDALWLYLIVRLKAPEQIIESGTHKGFSAWLLRQAAPKAEIRTFDITHDNLAYKDSTVSYHCFDWSECSHLKPAKNHILFLDDHVSHARRIFEASEKGFEFLLVDDNFPGYTPYATGMPPIPTVEMILNEDSMDGEVIEWQRNGKARNYITDLEQIERAKANIAKAIVYPDLHAINYYGAQSRLTQVELKTTAAAK